MENNTSKPTEIQVKMDDRKFLAVCPGGADGAITGMCDILRDLLKEVKWRTYHDLYAATANVNALEAQIEALQGDGEE